MKRSTWKQSPPRSPTELMPRGTIVTCDDQVAGEGSIGESGRPVAATSVNRAIV
jgi:hypothetical protein